MRTLLLASSQRGRSFKGLAWGALLLFGGTVSCRDEEEGNGLPLKEGTGGAREAGLVLDPGSEVRIVVLHPGWESSTEGGCRELPLAFLDPPCSNSDIIVTGGCHFSSPNGALFIYSLEDDLFFPTPPLQLVLLSSESLLGGQGGEGGAFAGQSPPILPMWTGSDASEELTEVSSRFIVNTRDTLLVSEVLHSDFEAPYITSYDEDSFREKKPFFFAHVALVHDDQVLSLRRVIFEPTQSCTEH